MTEEEARKTPDEWLQAEEFKGIVVLDPDGWDRKNYDESWAEEITNSEMHKRLAISTCEWPLALLTAGLKRGLTQER